MEKITFTFDNKLGYVSEKFKGNVAVQCIFRDGGNSKVVVESRLDAEMPWSYARSIDIEKSGVFTIRNTAEGQEFRIRCSKTPISICVSKLVASSGSSSSSSPSEGCEDCDIDGLTELDFSGIGEEETHRIVNEAITEAEKKS